MLSGPVKLSSHLFRPQCVDDMTYKCINWMPTESSSEVLHNSDMKDDLPTNEDHDTGLNTPKDGVSTV